MKATWAACNGWCIRVDMYTECNDFIQNDFIYIFAVWCLGRSKAATSVTNHNCSMANYLILATQSGH